MKEQVIQYIDTHSSDVYGLSDAIFDKPEQGFQEEFAAGLLTERLETLGYRVERGIGGLSTAFRAVYEQGTGGVSIGLLAEYDALPMGHACGHHMQTPIMILAAESIRRQQLNIPYKLVIYGTPAEEGFQGKVKMIEGGCFKDIDVALMTHASPNTTVDIKSLSGSKFSVTFRGIAAHESLTPELYRSGLDATILAFQGIEFLRGHVKEDVKFYCSINSCQGMAGHKDNTMAQSTVALRTYQAEDVPAIESRLKDVLQGAALMTGTTMDCVKVSDTMGKLPSWSLNGYIMANAELIDAPRRLAYRTRTGATDFAEVTHMMPGAVARFAFVPEGSTSHSQEFLDCGKSEASREGIKIGAKLIACTVLDLLLKPEAMTAVKAEFLKNKAEFEAQRACK